MSIPTYSNSYDLKEKMQHVLNLLSEYSGIIQEGAPGIAEKFQIHEFELSDQSPPDLVAVDGSYSFILNVSSVWIVILRIGALLYEFKENSSQIGYVLKESYFEDKPEVVASYREIVKKQSALHQELFKISLATGRKAHQTIADGLRRLAEHNLAHKLAGQMRDTIIALDGSLTTQPLPPFQDAMQELITNCKQNNNTLIGVSKDSKTHAFRSFMTDEELLRKAVPDRGLAFVRAPQSFEQNYTPPLYGDVYFAHLSPSAPKWFRIDLGTNKETPTEVFSNLAHYARSEICPGYIFPLIEAHRYVVAVRHFHQVYEELVFELGPQYGLKPDDIVLARTNIEGRRYGAFHEFLDRISRR
ncbi:MAG: DNA double-strand break repair nuclease NurA [Candidatus Heimdallarchaeota archaeon]